MENSPPRHQGTKESVPAETDRVARRIVNSAFRVHSTLGPGLLESVYEACLEHELRKLGHTVRRQVVLPVHYDGLVLEAGLRLDLVVDDRVIVEVKAVDAILGAETY
jgi:GxxExxY protein